MNRGISALAMLRAGCRTAVLILQLASPATAQEVIRGPVDKIIDGDTLVVEGKTVRIWGIDAPEMTQHCWRPSGEPYDCGDLSRFLLDAAAGTRVTCEVQDHDSYGRSVARCLSQDGYDVGARMVLWGAAVDYREYSRGAYLQEEIEAQQAGRGMWNGRFQPPAEWRRERR